MGSHQASIILLENKFSVEECASLKTTKHTNAETKLGKLLTGNFGAKPAFATEGFAIAA